MYDVAVVYQWFARMRESSSQFAASKLIAESAEETEHILHCNISLLGNLAPIKKT
jgi:hypothetical protein